jgi:hypothetical protein
MNRLLLASAAALLMTAGVAVAQTAPPRSPIELADAAQLMAQTTTSQTTTSFTPAPVIVAPPEGTLSTTRTRKTIDEDGTRTDTNRTTYRNSNGVGDDSETRTTTYPSPADTTTRSSTTTITR